MRQARFASRNHTRYYISYNCKHNRANRSPRCIAKRKRVNAETEAEEKYGSEEITEGNNEMLNPLAMLGFR
ncbi:hypothetical protein D3C80_2077020 [compost metagenome]